MAPVRVAIATALVLLQLQLQLTLDVCTTVCSKLWLHFATVDGWRRRSPPPPIRRRLGLLLLLLVTIGCRRLGVAACFVVVVLPCVLHAAEDLDHLIVAIVAKATPDVGANC